MNNDDVLQEYTGLYHSAHAQLTAPCAPLLNEPRQAAIELLSTIGLPRHRQEEYRYTDVAPLFAHNYGLNLRRAAVRFDPYKEHRCDIPQMSSHLFYLLNDAFCPAPQEAAPLPQGVMVESLNKILREQPALAAPYYNRLAAQERDGLVQLNTALVQDGLFVYLPKGAVVEKTLQIIALMHADMDLMAQRRILVVAEAGAKARLLLCDHTADNVQFLTNQVIELFAGEGAQIDLCEIEETHTANHRLSSLLVEQQRDSLVRINNTVVTNGLTRNSLHLSLCGEGSECRLTGLAIADKKQRVDNHVRIEHRAAHCTSNQLYKYVLDDSAVGAFAGRVLVCPGAQKSEAQQTNRNLCLTREARMYTQPQLEIYADDVKCSHGATVGQLDESAMFYMQQRGIGQKEARYLLMSAFVNEVIDKVQVEAVRNRLHLLVEKRFRGELDKCRGCTLCKQ